ncbi:MAG: transcription-repair coupling factor [Gammaproteobacteria bacterium]|nr:transcription-repair coupling factor [Gammaproteobacteria bacterium]
MVFFKDGVDLQLPAQGPEQRAWGQLYGAAPALAIAEAARHSGRPLLVVCSSARDVERLEAELGFLLAGSELPVVPLPDWETLPYDVFSPHQDIVSRRLATLNRLETLQQGVILVAAGTLLQRIAPREWLDGESFLMDVGDAIDLEALSSRLESAGYSRVSQVMEHGEFAVRGSLVDIFPMGSELPFRLDLFDDEIETIRSFDPDTQLSLEKLDKIRLLPAREFPLHPEAIKAFRTRYRARFEGDPSRSQVYKAVTDGNAPSGVEYYLPLFFEQTSTLFDYLPAAVVACRFDTVDAALDEAWAQIEDRYEQRHGDIERPLLAPAEIAVAPDEAKSQLAALPGVDIHSFELLDASNGHNFDSVQPPELRLNSRQEEPARLLLDFLASFNGAGGRALFVAESTGRRETLLDLLKKRKLDPQTVASWPEFLASDAPVVVCVAPLQEGIHLPRQGISVIAEPQLFGERARTRSRRRAVRDPDTIIRDLTDLAVGSPVVHEEHGVGRYRGLKALDIGESQTEFLTLEYAGGDKLYVPVHALHLISRYTGTSPESAPLHRLGSEQWSKAKKRAAEKARDAAVELLDIYSRRAARKGHQYRLTQEDYQAFCDDFPFDETIDQTGAINGVVKDMTSAQPMDRLVCGDVGFGKTEVAMRAAFVAVQGGKQVAMLVPTTLLAQQHYQTFRDRFADWPVKIGVHSRFRTQKEKNAVFDGMESGQLDIVVGTHGLLSDQARFKDLGLVIIDEEHRFGVRHKEKLKRLRAEVDVLTLTATPIPRTLNMSLSGIRDLSIIATPPMERLSVKTFVSEWNDALIREAILREIKRGGQAYFVHNEVETIEKFAHRVRELVPEAEVRVAHGQMRESELEQVMLDFYHRRFNVLLATTIIESGIDVPTANTIVINRADKFGLAQLHQMRGRVGRSHHRAYAYLLTPPKAVLTADAVKRLEAIESLEDLGAGFTLATHDLEIRGAGELLGEGQSGQIQEVGFTLYTELLERAVKALKDGETPDLEAPLDHGPEVDLKVPAILPDDYVPDVHMRLVMYKRIASAASEEALDELQVEMIDRFGLLPEPAKNLFRITALKLKAAPLGIRKIEAADGGGRLVFTKNPSIEPLEIIKLVQTQPSVFKLDGEEKLRFKTELLDLDERIDFVERLLATLSPSQLDRASNA